MTYRNTIRRQKQKTRYHNSIIVAGMRLVLVVLFIVNLFFLIDNLFNASYLDLKILTIFAYCVVLMLIMILAVLFRFMRIVFFSDTTNNNIKLTIMIKEPIDDEDTPVYHKRKEFRKDF